MKEGLLTCFIELLIVELEKEQRNGTAHVYRSTLNRLRTFMNGQEMSFDQLTAEWLNLFQKHLLAGELKWNTVSTYMRMLRAIYHKAVERGITPYVPRLFNKVHTGVDSPVKRAVPREVISTLMKSEKKLPQRLAFSRDVFVLLFLLRGMSFVDLAFLRKCDLQAGVITYHRHKTGRKITVSVPPEAMAILEKYRDERSASPYLFPIIKQLGHNEYGQYTRMLRLQNYNLLLLARALNIRERLSTYTARHTWATTALQQNYNANLICDAMGHSSVKVTETYFQPFKEAEINKMNRNIIAFMMG